MIETVPQIKKIFSEEALAYINELQKEILGLDANLPTFLQQVDCLLSTRELLRDSAIKADFYVPKSSFVEIMQQFEDSIKLLRDRHSDVDRTLKSLLCEAIDMMSQIINEYCFETQVSSDWIDKQSTLFEQINKHLILNSSELESLKISDKDNEPFNLDNSPEALHLFDMDFELDSDDDLYQATDRQYDSDRFLLIQLDDEAESLGSLELSEGAAASSRQEFMTLFPSLPSEIYRESLDEQADNEISNYNGKDKLPMPELLADIFPVNAEEKYLGHEDETELQGVSWDDVENDNDDLWSKFPSLESWSAIEDNNEISTLREMEINLDRSNDRKKSDNLLSDNFSDSLDEDENAFWNSLESIEDLQSSQFLEDRSVSVDRLDRDSESILLEELKKTDFSNSDIDTAIEESPIYQNNSNSSQSPLEEVSLTSLDSRELPEIDINSDAAFLSAANASNGSNIRIPINYLEMLEDLSEELLVRKGSLDIYLGEMRLVLDGAQKNLQLLEPSVSGQNAAIANLSNAFESLTNILDRTEHKTYEIGQDVRHLRKNFRQVLKHPISSLVRKFPRILRDLSLQYGKQVELIVQGAEIGIERAISEIVADPLELLLRSAFEHGIESPNERQKLGKSAQGKIEVIAKQTDESTVIKVSDDGYGLGNDVDLSNLREKIIEIGGTISRQVQIGKGTGFTVVLPNILSVLRVLLIDVNQMCLAIPSKAILEVISMNVDEENRETLEWRDLEIPIVTLNSFLKLNCRHNLNQAFTQVDLSGQVVGKLENHKPANAVPAFLVIKHENDLFALQTDGCWSDQEATFHQIEGDLVLPQIFLGSVILGSNQAVVLLNVAELVNQYLRSRSNEEEVQTIAKQPHQNLQDLNSLSDFFMGDDASEQSNRDDSSELPVRVKGRVPEPENLESSVILLSEETTGQTKRHHQSKVLIVESSANVRRYLAMTLARSGFLTEQVQDGKEAIAFLKESQKNNLAVDIVITDLEMPHMDGFKLLSSIRSDESLHNLPIVVLTARNNENDQKLALDLGANAYFSKPYHEQELVAKLQQLTSS